MFRQCPCSKIWTKKTTECPSVTKQYFSIWPSGIFTKTSFLLLVSLVRLNLPLAHILITSSINWCAPSAFGTDFKRSSAQNVFFNIAAAISPNFSPLSVAVFLGAKLLHDGDELSPNKCAHISKSTEVFQKYCRSTLKIWFVKLGPNTSSWLIDFPLNSVPQSNTSLIFPGLFGWCAPWCEIYQLLSTGAGFFD